MKNNVFFAIVLVLPFMRRIRAEPAAAAGARAAQTAAAHAVEEGVA